MQLKRQRTPRLRTAGSALRALTTSALALPGIAGAEGQTGEISLEYGFSHYSEDKLPASKVTDGGERSRYEIFINDFHLRYPIAERLSLGLDVVHETMSGATPWYVIPDADGDPVQVMTGATIEDQRTDLLASGRYYLDNGNVSLATGGQQVQVSVVDQFQQPTLLDVEEPKWLCNPVNKDDTEIRNPAGHLLCYEVERAEGEPRFEKVEGIIHTANQFGSLRLDAKKEKELCVPSEKDDTNAVPIPSD